MENSKEVRKDQLKKRIESYCEAINKLTHERYEVDDNIQKLKNEKEYIQIKIESNVCECDKLKEEYKDLEGELKKQ